PPTVSATWPDYNGVVLRHGSLHIQAACTDDRPGCQLAVGFWGSPTIPCINVFATGVGTIDEVVQLPDPSQGELSACARDSAGQTTSIQGPVIIVNGSPVLVDVESVPGVIEAYDADRILWATSDGFAVRDRHTGQDTRFSGGAGHLVPGGGVVF